MGLGLVYILFDWAGIPSIIGVIEGSVYSATSDENFDKKYNKAA